MITYTCDACKCVFDKMQLCQLKKKIGAEESDPQRMSYSYPELPVLIAHLCSGCMEKVRDVIWPAPKVIALDSEPPKTISDDQRTAV